MKSMMHLVFVTLALLSGSVFAEPQNRVDVAYENLQAKTKQQLVITSEDFTDGQAIPLRNSSYGESISPQLQWNAGPAGTLSYALLLEDENGVRDGKAIVHWILFNIPANVLSLSSGLSREGTLAVPKGALQGVTISGATGYLGPKPRDPDHHYHFQLFALDHKLDLPAGTTRDAFVEAIQGHVLAKGRLVGVFSPPAKP